MARIRILKCNEVQELPVSNGSQSAVIPVDGKFHRIADELLGALGDSSVEFEIEAPRVKAKAAPKAASKKRRAAKRERAPAGAAAGLGGSAAAPSKK
jgi:hypothetical protein